MLSYSREWVVIAIIEKFFHIYKWNSTVTRTEPFHSVALTARRTMTPFREYGDWYPTIYVTANHMTPDGENDDLTSYFVGSTKRLDVVFSRLPDVHDKLRAIIREAAAKPTTLPRLVVDLNRWNSSNATATTLENLIDALQMCTVKDLKLFIMKEII